MMCPWNIFRGYIFYQFAFYLKGSVCRGSYQTKTMTDTKDMGIYRHCRLSKCNTLYHVSRLTPHTGQVEQQVHVCRNLALVSFHQLASHLDQMFSLGIRIGNATESG